MTSTLLHQCDLLFSSTPLEGPEQMALDDLFLQTQTKPLLRLYCWKRACVTFGYFQQWSAVRESFPSHQIVRRPTGGGCVVHGADRTFSLIVPCRESLRRLSPLFFYKVIHLALAEVLRKISITTHLATPEEVGENACCFAAPALNDLLWKGKKILGGAQRRHRGNLLYQGSLSLPRLSSSLPALEGSVLKNFFHEVALCLSQEVNIIEEDPRWIQEATFLGAKQYRLESWTKKR